MKSKIIKSILVNTGIIITLCGILLVSFYFYGIRMAGRSYEGPLKPLSAESEQLRERLKAHVRVLAAEIGTRNAYKRASLEQAADYIEQQFSSFRYVPKTEIINEDGFRNIVVDLYSKQGRDLILLVGAHYDTTWSTPGADDNASGVAALIEIARHFRDKQLPVSLRFVAFVNEEYPFYGTDKMGSRFHAQRAREQGENIIGMFSMEMLGFYSDEYRSQYYPKVIRRFYPRRGNFIAFVSNLISRPLLVAALSGFREQVEFPTQGLAAPQWLVRGIRRSDHASFWINGYQAIMITDTANYRNYGYHNLGDTYNSLDYDRMTIVVDGIMKMLENLAWQY